MTSVKEWIDDKIKNGDIDYFEYDEFSNIFEVGRGGFGKVSKAYSTSMGIEVALKSSICENSEIEENIIHELIKELKLLYKVRHPNINRFLGITKVLDYANEKDLRNYLKKKFTSLEWKDKIQMAQDITCGLKYLHSKDIIHRDLHSKNILVNNGRLLIADLGLSKQLADVTSNSMANGMGIYGYVEPQYFKDSSYKRDKRSDIYSLGVLFWEISRGRPPFFNIDPFFIGQRIRDGKRETPVENTPFEYQQLYQKCWNEEPGLRPNIEEVHETLTELKSKFDPVESQVTQDFNNECSYSDDLKMNFIKNLNQNQGSQTTQNSEKVMPAFLDNNNTSGSTSTIKFEDKKNEGSSPTSHHNESKHNDPKMDENLSQNQDETSTSTNKNEDESFTNEQNSSNLNVNNKGSSAISHYHKSERDDLENSNKNKGDKDKNANEQHEVQEKQISSNLNVNNEGSSATSHHRESKRDDLKMNKNSNQDNTSGSTKEKQNYKQKLQKAQKLLKQSYSSEVQERFDKKHPQKESITKLKISYKDCYQEREESNPQRGSLKIDGFTKLENIDLNNLKLTSLKISNCSQLTEIILSELTLSTNLKISHCSELHEVKLSGCQIESLSVSDCLELTKLDCPRSGLTELDISNLIELNCSNNKIKYLNLNLCPTIITLNCSDNDLNILEIRSGSKLEVLNCHNNRLTSLDISNCPELKKHPEKIITTLNPNLIISENGEAIRNLLIVGCTLSGKSTLANVLCDNITENFQKGFKWRGTNYRVVDTVKVGDTGLDEKEVFYKIAEWIHFMPEGISQVLVTFDGRFTTEEIKTFNIFEKYSKSNIIKYITIVRTKFDQFQIIDECEKDRNKLLTKNEKIAELVESCSIVYVDHPPINIVRDDDYDIRMELNIKRREKSRDILLDHLEKVVKNKKNYKLKVWNQLRDDIADNMKKIELEDENSGAANIRKIKLKVAKITEGHLNSEISAFISKEKSCSIF